MVHAGCFDRSAIHDMLEESVKMKSFSHQNVLSLLGVCVDAGPTPYIVMPYMSNGSLQLYLRKEREDLLFPEEPGVDAEEDKVSSNVTASLPLSPMADT